MPEFLTAKDPTHLTSLPGSVRVGIRAALVTWRMASGWIGWCCGPQRGDILWQSDICRCCSYLTWPCSIIFYGYLRLSEDICQAQNQERTVGHLEIERLKWSVISCKQMSIFRDPWKRIEWKRLFVHKLPCAMSKVHEFGWIWVIGITWSRIQPLCHPYLIWKNVGEWPRHMVFLFWKLA